jgi:antibiotic biosynthesis monooxygenase (ABM) superfamily enzyme
MGTDIIAPTDKETKPEYVIIFSFNNYDNLTI